MKRIYVLCLILAFALSGCGRTTAGISESAGQEETDAEEQEVDEALDNILNQLDELDQILDGNMDREETADE